jgi:hypothetical protein
MYKKEDDKIIGTQRMANAIQKMQLEFLYKNSHLSSEGKLKELISTSTIVFVNNFFYESRRSCLQSSLEAIRSNLINRKPLLKRLERESEEIETL